jgi:hypothetical protein
MMGQWESSIQAGTMIENDIGPDAALRSDSM